MTTNIVIATFGTSKAVRTRALYQWDYGQVLQFEGLELPSAYTVHFSNQGVGGTAKTMIGDAEGVDIPDEYLTTGRTVYAWVYLHAGEDDGETMYAVVIPVTQRPQPTEEAPTPVQQGAIDAAIAALNAAVEQTEADVAAAQTARAGAEAAQEAAEAAQELAEDAAQSVGQAATDAEGSATQAAQSASDAASAAASASVDAAAATEARADAQTEAAAAAVYAYNARNAGQAADNAAQAAAGSASTAAQSATDAAGSASGAAGSATAAAGSASGAAASAAAAAASEAAAQEAAEASQADYTELAGDVHELKSAMGDKLDAPATPGTSGQVLTSDGAGGQSWETPNPTVIVTGTTPTITALSGVRYICGEVATLDITLPASGIVDVIFVSGSTPTVLTTTPPTGQTVKWANDFDPDNLDADTTYEINILDGLGVAGSWT